MISASTFPYNFFELLPHLCRLSLYFLQLEKLHQKRATEAFVLWYIVTLFIDLSKNMKYILNLKEDMKLLYIKYDLNYIIYYIIVYNRSSNHHLTVSTRWPVGIFKVQRVSVFSDTVSIQLGNVSKRCITPR